MTISEKFETVIAILCVPMYHFYETSCFLCNFILIYGNDTFFCECLQVAILHAGILHSLEFVISQLFKKAAQM